MLKYRNKQLIKVLDFVLHWFAYTINKSIIIIYKICFR